MRFPRKRGSTSVMVRVFIPDNSVTTGAGCTGLTSGSTNLAVAYSRELQNGFTQITGSNLVTITTIGTWASPGTGKLGFKAVDATNAPGLYEIHFPNDAAAFGTGDTSQHVIINVLELTTTALKIGPNMVLIPLVPWDYQDGVAMGMTAFDARSEPGQGAPPVSTTFMTKVDYLYKFLRNKADFNKGTGLKQVYADNGSTVDHKTTDADDGTTYTKGEFISGP